MNKFELSAMRIYERHRTPDCCMPPWHDLPSWYKHQFICEIWLISHMMHSVRSKLVNEKRG